MEKNERPDRILTVPNGLTLIRFLMIGVVIYLFVKKNPVAALAVYLAATATDLLDGYIARHFNQVSNVGKVADPIADKLMTVTALGCMYAQGYLTPGVLVVIIVKEALMIVGGAFAYFVFKKVVYANLFGKISAVAYFIAVVLLFLHNYVKPADAWAMYAAVAMNLVSMVQYGYINIVREYRKRKVPPVI